MNGLLAWKGRSLRILYVVPGSGRGNSMVFVHEQITHLTNLGLETRTFNFDVGANVFKAWKHARALRRLVQKFQPDILHAQYGSLTSFTCALISRAPLIITFRGSDLLPTPFDGAIRSRGQGLLSQLAALRASAIICVSQEIRDKLWWRRDKATVIPSGVDSRDFYPIIRAEARRRLGWGDHERVVVFNAGNPPSESKRQDLAEASVEVMRKSIGDMRFVVFRGDIPHRLVPMYLCGADCLIQTSDSEGSPNIVKEALACGLPIVSVDVGDVKERLKGVSPSRIVPRDADVIGTAAAEIVLSGQRSNGPDHIFEVSALEVRAKIFEVYCQMLNSSSHLPVQ